MTVSIGLPIYNGGELLREALDCLRAQTHRDFEAVIVDNASTDGTEALCRALAEQDPRFVYRRNAENVGALNNFRLALETGSRPYFLWQAHDDLRDPDFIEKTLALLEADPSKILAVGRVVKQKHRPRGLLTRTAPYRQSRGAPRLARITRNLFASHECWFYGLWRREPLTRLFLKNLERYPHAWGMDHLAIAEAVLDDAVAGTNETQFYERMFVAEKRGDAKETIGDAELMLTRRMQFFDALHTEMDARGWRGTEAALLRTVLRHYSGNRIATWSKIARARRRERRGAS